MTERGRNPQGAKTKPFILSFQQKRVEGLLTQCQAPAARSRSSEERPETFHFHERDDAQSPRSVSDSRNISKEVS